MTKNKYKDDTTLWFYMDSFGYPDEGMYIITAKQAEKVMLDSKISQWIGKHTYKNLRELLEANVWENWEDHAPFELKSFYENAVILIKTNYKTVFYVSE